MVSDVFGTDSYTCIEVPALIPDLIFNTLRLASATAASNGTWTATVVPVQAAGLFTPAFGLLGLHLKR